MWCLWLFCFPLRTGLFLNYGHLNNLFRYLYVWNCIQCYYMVFIFTLLAFFLILYLWDFVHVDMYISVHITFNCSVLSHCINKPQLIYLNLLLIGFCIDLSLSLYSFLLLHRNGIWVFLYTSPSEEVQEYLWDVHLGFALLVHRVYAFSILLDSVQLFSKVVLEISVLSLVIASHN